MSNIHDTAAYATASPEIRLMLELHERPALMDEDMADELYKVCRRAAGRELDQEEASRFYLRVLKNCARTVIHNVRNRGFRK